MPVDAKLLPDIVSLARRAGDAILGVYGQQFEVTNKADHSPLTLADTQSHDIIVQGLRALTPDIAVLSEEASDIPYSERRQWQRYWLVDPLDGTKEFVRGGDDYTVNIGLIEGGTPKLGVVFAPASARLHGGCVGAGAWLDEGEGRRLIRTRARGAQLTAVASKSHLNQATVDYLEAAVGLCDFVAVGSSLKFCIVAEGEADIYPRASPTSEWDTAAGHAVLLAAGGVVYGPDGSPLRYGKRAFVNRAFVATSGWEPPALDRFLEPFSGGGDLAEGV